MFYAVKSGRKPGIYLNWEECKAQVSGYQNAKFHKFKTEYEAKEYLGSKDGKIKTSNKLIYPIAFIDGSYNKKENIYGYGGFIQISENSEKIIIQGNGKEKDLLPMMNISGEILGCQQAIKKAINLNLKELNIYYDYLGIEKWATKEWKANKVGTIEYQNFIDSISNKININFIKVAAHTGINGNELADTLAKQAVNL